MGKVTMLVLVVAVMCMMMRCMKGDNAGKGGRLKLRKKEVSVYFHDTVNVTDFIVVQAPRPGPITPIDSPFGLVYVFNDLVTEGPDPASTPLGNITGAFIAISPGGGGDYLTPLVLTLSSSASPSSPHLQGLHGTLTMSGIASATNQQPQPITGGTGSFAFVQGTRTVVGVDVSTFSQVFRLDLVLYWPPYAL